MSEPRRCPQCDAEIPANSPAGLCPRCLLKASADSQSAVSAELGPTKLTPPVSGFVPPTVEELAPLFPQLEILELLGKGGMGAVYKARQPGLDRLVALKILPPEISRDPAFAERFQREARALAKLSHPHIVAVYDFGQTTSGRVGQVIAAHHPQDQQQLPGTVGREDLAHPAPESQPGLCYIVMEFVDGANLRQAIRTGTLTSAEALAIVPQICEALQFAHDEGVVHRDIKPENILIDKRGRVKIADFGLAKLLGQDASEHSLTATHQVMGTLRYMAPEQMQGSREVDHRADIYSLGVVFYELLTGELPLGKFAPPSKKVQIDVRLDEVVLRALEQDPEQRYQHASDVKSEIDSIRTTPLPASVARAESSKGVELSRVGTATPSEGSRSATPPTSPMVKFLRSILWLVVIIGAVMFCWFEKVTYHGNFDSNRDPSNLRIGAVQPWLIVGKDYPSGHYITPNFATVSAFAGLFALVAGLALNSARRPTSASVVRTEAATDLESEYNVTTTPIADSGHANQPSYAKRVGIPMAILFGLYSIATMTAQTVYGQKDNYQEPRVLLIIVSGATLFWVGVIILNLAFFARRKSVTSSGSNFTGTPLTQMRFSVPATTDIARQAIFHFSSLGYQVIEQQPDAVVFQRGGQWAGLWETDIRKIATRLTVRTAPAAEGQSWVSCDWSMRALGAWGTRHDIRQLEAEGDGFKTLLGVAVPSESQAAENLRWPRFSRFAIAGAVWAIFGLLTVIPVLYFIGLNRVWNGTAQPTDVIYAVPPLPFTIFMGALLAIGAGAPIGTTIFGAVALRHIKQSDGKVLGLRLAQADVLFYPVLLLAVASFLAGFMIVRNLLRGLPPMMAGLDEWFYQSPRQEFVAALIALPIWFFPARALWRAVVGPREAFAIRNLPLVGNEPLTGKGALVLALAAIAAHGWPWHWIIMPPPASRSLTISNFDLIDALQSFWLLVASIGLALFASAATLARPAKLVLRIASMSAAITALVIQVQFFRSLGEFEPGQPTVVRLTRTYSHMGVYVTMALTGLAILFFVLRLFEGNSERQASTPSPEQPHGITFDEPMSAANRAMAPLVQKSGTGSASSTEPISIVEQVSRSPSSESPHDLADLLPRLTVTVVTGVFGGLTMAAGVALATYAILTESPSTGEFWGWMGGAFGCFFGGGGALIGAINSYRQLVGAGDLMTTRDTNWLDRVLLGYGLLGGAALVTALAWTTLASPARYSIGLLGTIVVFQAGLMSVLRTVSRKG